MKNRFAKVAAIALVALSAASAMATPTIGNADKDDVTLGGENADALVFSSVNPAAGDDGNTSGFASAFASYGMGGWTLLGKIESNHSASSGPLVFNFSQAPKSSTSGTWSVQNTSSKDLDLDLVFDMHASKASTAFLFDDQIIKANSTLTGNWSIEWLNNGGQVPGFSNLEFFDRSGTMAPPPVTGNVPEPASLALLGAGLLGLACAKRRRQK